MKLSFKLQDDNPHHRRQPPQNAQSHPLLRAKIPVTIFNLPFLSAFSTTATTHPSDLTLSLSTNFSSGPSLKLSYSTTSASATTTTSAATTTTATSPLPLTLTLKSGIGLFGSPKESPLVISANFSFSPNNPNFNPTFSLLLKPQLGSFSVRKSTFSNPNPNGKVIGDAVNSFGFVPLERPLSLKGFSVDKHVKDSIFKGISVLARTEMPMAKRASLSFRWGMNFPEDLSKQMPFLSVNKISIERMDEKKEVKEGKEKKSEGNSGEGELLKSMCLWMKREMDVLQRENRELKHRLGEIRLDHLERSGNISGNDSSGKNRRMGSEASGGFEQWRKTRASGGEESVKKEPKKNGDGVNNVESELERAIKAASS